MVSFLRNIVFARLVSLCAARFVRVTAAAAAAVALGIASVDRQAAFAQAQPEYRCAPFTLETHSTWPLLVAAKDGAVWYVDRNGNRLIRVGRDRTSRPIVPVDAATVSLTGLTAAPDGAIWYSKDKTHRIGRIPPGGGKGVEYELPAPNLFAAGIAAAPDGRIWFADPVGNKVGVITKDGNVTSYDAPVINGSPASPADGIAVADDGSVWVTSTSHNAVYRVDPGDGTFKKFDIATPEAQPAAIAAGSDGALWFVMPAVGKIGRITTDGRITEYAQKLIGLRGIAAGPGGAIWYGTNEGIGRIDPATGRIRTFACDGRGGLAIGSDGHLWVLGDGEMFVVRPQTESTKARATHS